ncbi:BspA family leucine-rich repeat surface protein [Mycoplasma yeatsii]|uniref:BspA family leucine-rich repeat surface protein n=1 Tax=Mycoplasma yeatsii TaxID=51365 RepID=UPI0005B24672|nr:BspA family leucine-rich repeat surface protein [Mycoplasma yeatsii]AJM71941.1 PARCEL domain-containing protein [Mycoplasma yeatsii GM274B]
MKLKNKKIPIISSIALVFAPIIGVVAGVSIKNNQLKTKEKHIAKIKQIWDSEFKDKFFDESLKNINLSFNFKDVYLTNQKLLKTVTKRLKAHGLNISISKGEEDIEDKVWNETVINHKHKTQTFKIKYQDEVISLPFGEFNKVSTKFKDDSFEEITEIGYLITPDGLFTAIFLDSKSIDKQSQEKQKASLKKVPKILPPTIDSLNSAFSFIDGQEIKGIEKWDTSNVISMKNVFNGSENFNQALNWNTKNVIDMSGMFNRTSFNNDSIIKWNTSNVTNMSFMFFGATSFNQDINSWDVSNITNMSSMFANAEKFKKQLTKWDTSKVTNMSGMFANAVEFNGDIRKWKTSNVTDMSQMFLGSDSFDQDISGWDTSKVTRMNQMFLGTKNFNQNISSWNTSNVTNMSSMFEEAAKFDQNIGNWDVSNVTNMSSMFKKTKSFNQNIGNWDTSSVTDMRSMFSKAEKFNQDISTKQVQKGELKYTAWDVSNVKNMSEMFSGAKSFKHNISNWDVSKCERFENFIKGDSKMTKNLIPEKFRDDIDNNIDVN